MGSEIVALKVGDVFVRGDDEWQVADIGTDDDADSVLTLGSVDGGTTELGASGAGIPELPLA